MNVKMIGAALASMGLATVTLRGADDPKSADELIGRYVEAIGGRQAIDAVKSIRITGKTTINGFPAPITIEKARPNKVRTEIDFQGVTFVTAFDQEHGWVISPSGGGAPEKMSDTQLARTRDQADFDGPLIDYKKKGHKVELVGKGEIDGTPTYKLKVERKSGTVEFVHLDPEVFLIVARTTTHRLDETEIEEVTLYGDYRAVRGRMFPYSVETQTGSVGEGLLTIEKIEVNPSFPDNRFTRPLGK